MLLSEELTSDPSPPPQLRVHFSPVVSQLRYRQHNFYSDQNPNRSQVNSSPWPSSTRINQGTSSFQEHPTTPSPNPSSYAAPYYYSNLQLADIVSRDNPVPAGRKQTILGPNARQNMTPTGQLMSIEKVTVHQGHRPSQEKVQRVQLNIPPPTQYENEKTNTQAYADTSRAGQTPYHTDTSCKTYSHDNHTPLDYPDLLMGSPCAVRSRALYPRNPTSLTVKGQGLTLHNSQDVELLDKNYETAHDRDVSRIERSPAALANSSNLAAVPVSPFPLNAINIPTNAPNPKPKKGFAQQFNTIVKNFFTIGKNKTSRPSTFISDNSSGEVAGRGKSVGHKRRNSDDDGSSLVSSSNKLFSEQKPVIVNQGQSADLGGYQSHLITQKNHLDSTAAVGVGNAGTAVASGRFERRSLNPNVSSHTHGAIAVRPRVRSDFEYPYPTTSLQLDQTDLTLLDDQPRRRLKDQDQQVNFTKSLSPVSINKAAILPQRSTGVFPVSSNFQKTSPVIKRFTFKNLRTSPTNCEVDELSENFEKIMEEIADLDNIIDGLSPEQEVNDIKPEKMSEYIQRICSDLSKLSIQTDSTPIPNTLSMESQYAIKSLVNESVKTISAKPPIPPSSSKSTPGMRHQFFGNCWVEPSPPGPLKGKHRLASDLERKLLEFREEVDRSREEIAKSYPNFEEMDNSVRSSMAIDRFGRNPQSSAGKSCNESWETSSPSSSYSLDKNPTEEYLYAEQELLSEWNKIIHGVNKKVSLPQPQPPSSNYNNEEGTSTTNCTNGILETDLDTGTSRKVYIGSTDKTSSPVEYPINASGTVVKSSRRVTSSSLNFVQRNSCSMQNLNQATQLATLAPCDPNSKEDRSRSMEFLVDDPERNAHLLPPENTLKKTQDNRQASEHELSVQRSLQRLNVPEWYKTYATAGSNSVSKSGSKEFGSGSGLAGGWSGLSNSKTSSLTSLQSAGRYSSNRLQYPSSQHKGTVSTGGRSSRESLMSPSSTASASPSPYYERSSFTYGMPYALTRFAAARMSCGASPASLSPSPSPVGGITSSTSTPVSSCPSSRYGYNKTPYLGWRSQERLNSKSLYKSPSERLAADLLAQKQKVTTPLTDSSKSLQASNTSIVTSPRKETASDLSLNTSDDSASNKLNRVRSSIKEVSNAIVDYVNESKPLDYGINGRASPRRGLVWLESSFVGTKPIDSPSTPDTPTVIMSSTRHYGSQGSAYNPKRSSFKHDEQNGDKSLETPGSAVKDQAFNSYISRNEKIGDRSNSSSVSSPTLEDILDSLLALRRPQKKIRARKKGHKDYPKTEEDAAVEDQPKGSYASISKFETPISDWQQRMNQPLDDSAYFPADTDSFVVTSAGSNNDDNRDKANSYSSSKYEESAFTNPPVPVRNAWECDNYLGQGANRNEVGGTLLQEDSDVVGRIAQEETEFGSPTEINTTINSSINPLAGLNESSSNPPTPRHRKVSFDLDISDKDEKSSSRSKRDESIGGVIQCRNSKCAKTASGLEARREFKTCHNCNAYYCSRECRRIHWEKHKKVCMQSRVGQLCKQIISHVKDDSFVVSQLSTTAKRGFLAKGRGCVKLFFSSPDRAERFLTGGLPELPEPWYIPHSDMLPEEMGTQTFSELSDNCKGYNPETRFVLYATVCVVNEVPTSGAVKWEREMISRSAKIRLLLPRSFDESQPHHHAANPAHINSEESLIPSPYSSTMVASSEDSTYDNETLILRSVPIPLSQKLNSSDDRRRREVSFTSIQKHLIERGVDLRRTYPDIYSKLCNYVENDEPFLPVTIYPTNSQTGHQFMCVIMPESSETAYGISLDSFSKVKTINISEQS